MRRAVDPVEVQHQGALPRTVRSEQRNLLTARDQEVHTAERLGPIGVAKVQMRDGDRAVACWCKRRIVRMVMPMAVRHRKPWMRVRVFVLFRHSFSLQSRQQRATEGEGEHQQEHPDEFEREAWIGGREGADGE